MILSHSASVRLGHPSVMIASSRWVQRDKLHGEKGRKVGVCPDCACSFFSSDRWQRQTSSKTTSSMAKSFWPQVSAKRTRCHALKLAITGGASKMVKEALLALMKHGCDSIIIGRRQNMLDEAAKELSAASGKRCIPIASDVRDADRMAAAVQQGVTELGRLDFVVCGGQSSRQKICLSHAES
jgi:hypothetical protein